MRAPRATFHMVDLTASDVLATVAFYRRLGVDIPDEKVWAPEGPGGKAHHVEARLTPDTGLGINSSELTARYDTSGGRGSYLIFSVDSRAEVDFVYDDLTGAGYAGHLAPFDAFWGSRYAVVDDPDGNHVGIMSPQDLAHQASPDVP